MDEDWIHALDECRKKQMVSEPSPAPEAMTEVIKLEEATWKDLGAQLLSAYEKLQIGEKSLARTRFIVKAPVGLPALVSSEEMADGSADAPPREGPEQVAMNVDLAPTGELTEKEVGEASDMGVVGVVPDVTGENESEEMEIEAPSAEQGASVVEAGTEANTELGTEANTELGTEANTEDGTEANVETAADVETGGEGDGRRSRRVRQRVVQVQAKPEVPEEVEEEEPECQGVSELEVYLPRGHQVAIAPTPAKAHSQLMYNEDDDNTMVDSNLSNRALVLNTKREAHDVTTFSQDFAGKKEGSAPGQGVNIHHAMKGFVLAVSSTRWYALESSAIESAIKMHDLLVGDSIVFDPPSTLQVSTLHHALLGSIPQEQTENRKSSAAMTRMLASKAMSQARTRGMESTVELRSSFFLECHMLIGSAGLELSRLCRRNQLEGGIEEEADKIEAIKTDAACHLRYCLDFLETKWDGVLLLPGVEGIEGIISTGSVQENLRNLETESLVSQARESVKSVLSDRRMDSSHWKGGSIEDVYSLFHQLTKALQLETEVEMGGIWKLKIPEMLWKERGDLYWAYLCCVEIILAQREVDRGSQDSERPSQLTLQSLYIRLFTNILKREWHNAVKLDPVPAPTVDATTVEDGKVEVLSQGSNMVAMESKCRCLEYVEAFWGHVRENRFVHFSQLEKHNMPEEDGGKEEAPVESEDGRIKCNLSGLIYSMLKRGEEQRDKALIFTALRGFMAVITLEIQKGDRQELDLLNSVYRVATHHDVLCRERGSLLKILLDEALTRIEVINKEEETKSEIETTADGDDKSASMNEAENVDENEDEDEVEAVVDGYWTIASQSVACLYGTASLLNQDSPAQPYLKDPRDPKGGKYIGCLVPEEKDWSIEFEASLCGMPDCARIVRYVLASDSDGSRVKKTIEIRKAEMLEAVVMSLRRCLSTVLPNIRTTMAIEGRLAELAPAAAARTKNKAWISSYLNTVKPIFYDASKPPVVSDKVLTLQPLKGMAEIDLHAIALDAGKHRADRYIKLGLSTPHYSPKERLRDASQWESLCDLLEEALSFDPLDLCLWSRLGVACRKLWDVRLDIEAMGLRVATEPPLKDDLAQKADRCFRMVLERRSPAEAKGSEAVLLLTTLEERAVLAYTRLQAKLDVGLEPVEVTLEREELMRLIFSCVESASVVEPEALRHEKENFTDKVDSLKTTHSRAGANYVPGSLGCSRCRYGKNGCSQCREKAEEAAPSGPVEPKPSFIFPFLAGRIAEKKDSSDYATFLPLYSKACELISGSGTPKRGHGEVMYRLHASRLRLATQEEKLTAEAWSVLAKYSYIAKEENDTAQIASGMAKPGTEVDGDKLKADIIANAIKAMEACRALELYAHKPMYRIAHAYWIEYGKSGEDEVLKKAKAALRTLFNQANRFNIRMWIQGTNGGDPRAQCEPDDGIFCLQGRVSKYHRQEFTYLELYSKLCEETGDYLALYEGAAFLRSRSLGKVNHALYPVFLQASTGAFKKSLAEISDRDETEKNKLLQKLFEATTTEAHGLEELGLEATFKTMLLEAYAAAPNPTKVNDTDVPISDFGAIVAACKERFKEKPKTKGAKKQKVYVASASRRRARGLPQDEKEKQEKEKTDDANNDEEDDEEEEKGDEDVEGELDDMDLEALGRDLGTEIHG